MPDQDDVYRDGLLKMSDEEFRIVWELIVGERPAIMLARDEMIDALRSLIPMPSFDGEPQLPDTAPPRLPAATDTVPSMLPAEL